jgi:hypothetical protein
MGHSNVALPELKESASLPAPRLAKPASFIPPTRNAKPAPPVVLLKSRFLCYCRAGLGFTKFFCSLWTTFVRDIFL